VRACVRARACVGVCVRARARARVRVCVRARARAFFREGEGQRERYMGTVQDLQ
jgi:hypothetical protein